MNKKIGFTTTIPVEFVLAANNIPIDLNNIFVSDRSPTDLIDISHSDGLPRNCCTWIKGLYSVGVKKKSIDELVSVSNGDCSNTHALTELFEDANIPVHTFSYPYNHSNPYNELKNEMEKLAKAMGISFKEGVEFSKTTDKVRDKLKVLDQLTIEGFVTGFENHLWQVSSSDFNSNLKKFDKELDEIITIAKSRKKNNKYIRIGFIGVPTINPSIYNFIESKGCNVVFNEVQRQFTIPSRNKDYVERFLEYTYPYSVNNRIEDINNEIKNRSIDGIVHYVQSFCYRQIQDILIKKYIPIPVITIEGDMPGDIDGRTKIRIESFIEMLESKKRKCLV